MVSKDIHISSSVASNGASLATPALMKTASSFTPCCCIKFTSLDPIGNGPSVISHRDDIFSELHGRLIQGGLIASCNHDTRALICESKCCCQSDPTVAAGYKGNFSCKFV